MGLFDDDYVATKGDVKRSNERLEQQQKVVTEEVVRVRAQVDAMYENMSSQIDSLQRRTEASLNQLSDQLSNQFNKTIQKQNQKFEEIQKKLETPLANQASELRNRGIESFKNNWIDEAKEEFNKALELNSKDYISYAMLARIALKEGEIQKAYELYDKALKYSEPYDKEFYKNIGVEKTLFSLKNARETINYDIEKGIELYDEIINKLQKYDYGTARNVSIEKALKLLEFARKYEYDLDKAERYYDLALEVLKRVDKNLYQSYVIQKAFFYLSHGLKEKGLEELNNLRNSGLSLIKDFYYYEILYLVEIGEKNEALKRLKEYFNKNPKKEIEILNDKNFTPIKEEFENWLNSLKEKELNEIEKLKQKAKEEYEIINEAVAEAVRGISNEEKEKFLNSKKNFDNFYEEIMSDYDIQILEQLKFLKSKIKEFLELAKKSKKALINDLERVKSKYSEEGGIIVQIIAGLVQVLIMSLFLTIPGYGIVTYFKCSQYIDPPLIKCTIVTFKTIFVILSVIYIPFRAFLGHVNASLEKSTEELIKKLKGEKDG
jgi:tetratricopeptide (TPR) repeat protein